MKARALQRLLEISLFFSIACQVCASDEAQRLQSVKKFYEQKKWEAVVSAAQGPTEQSADFDYYAGMARIEKRYSRGLSFGVNYTWSKYLGNISTPGSSDR